MPVFSSSLEDGLPVVHLASRPCPVESTIHLIMTLTPTEEPSTMRSIVADEGRPEGHRHSEHRDTSRGEPV
jgi:hypothetical protein